MNVERRIKLHHGNVSTASPPSPRLPYLGAAIHHIGRIPSSGVLCVLSPIICSCLDMLVTGTIKTPELN